MAEESEADAPLQAITAIWVWHTLDELLSLVETTEIIDWECVKSKSTTQSGSDQYYAL